MMPYSQDCVALTKAFEGCRLIAYDDARPEYVLKSGDKIFGTLTCGWGATGPDIKIGTTWTQDQADSRLLSDLDRAYDEMDALVKVPLAQGQIDALTDFTFNDGSGRLEHSNLLTILNGGNYDEVPYELFHYDAENHPHGWIFIDGKPAPGLIRRRQAEIELWSKVEA